MRRPAVSSLVLAIPLLLSVGRGQSHAAPILDQQQPVIGVEVAGGALEHQQGVTAGLEGLLTQFDLYVYDISPPVSSTSLYLNVGSPWQTDTHDFLVVDPVLVPGWNSFDVASAGIFVSPGTQFVIGIAGLGVSQNPAFAQGFQPGYAGGSLYVEQVLSSDFQLAFQTYVDPDATAPAAVPEPATLLTLGMGLAIAGARRYRTRGNQPDSFSSRASAAPS